MNSEKSALDATMPALTRKRAVEITIALIALGLPAVFGSAVTTRVADLHALAQTSNPYWQPAHALLLYGAVPVVTLSSFALVLTSGLLLVLALGSARNSGEWLLQGFGITLPVLMVLNAILLGFASGAVSRAAFVAGVLTVNGVSAALVFLRIRRRALTDPLSGPADRSMLVTSALAVALIVAILLPKFFWENFNGDGMHAFEASRLLLTQPVPFWDPAAGMISNWPGTTSMLFTYPTSWFIQLFGPIEFSARVAVLLYLVLLFAGVFAFARNLRGRALALSEQWLLWLALFVYTVTVGFSGTYNPYSADLALPGTQDTLVVVCFVGVLLATYHRSTFWVSVWALFTFLTLPNGLLLMGFWWLGIVLFWKPRPMRLLVTLALIAMGCMLVGAVLPRISAMAGFPTPGEELGSGALLGRFNFLQLTDWRRFLYIVVPCGILPALSLVAWRRQNGFLHALTFTTLAYFFTTYIQAYASLHYYIPAMLLPLIVFWSMEWWPAKRSLQLVATAAAGALALWLSWPENTQPDVSGRTVGSAIEDRIGGYETSSPTQFRSVALLLKLFPYDWDPRVPSDAYGGSPIVWNHYAHSPRREPANYIVQRASDAAPAGATLVAREDGFALFVRDLAVWQAHKSLRPHSPAGARIYQIPREILFRSGSDGVRIVEMKALLRKVLRRGS